MVLFVDLSDDFHDPPSSTSLPAPSTDLPNRNHFHPFSVALALYPFLSGLAAELDHNDLYNLSSTCRQIHANLSDHRRTLLSKSVCCMNDSGEPRVQRRYPSDWRAFRGGSRCAKDLVNPCMRCQKTVCRNCIQKPNPNNTHSRIRRLCKPCQINPALLSPSDISAYDAALHGHPRICDCAESTWLCGPCSKDLNAEDYSYRLWCEMWVNEFMPSSNRYTYTLGGNFSGAYEENTWGAVRCARGSECGSAVKDVKEEQQLQQRLDNWEALADAIEEFAGDGWEGSGLIERKPTRWLKRRKGGREVEWDQNQEENKWALVAEWKGQTRGWCAWCDKVTLSTNDRQALKSR